MCLAQPALLPHFNCFTSGTPKGQRSLQHVRVLPAEDQQKCGEHKDRKGTYCFDYPHAGDSKSCLVCLLMNTDFRILSFLILFDNSQANFKLITQKLNNGSILFIFNKKVVAKRLSFRSYNKTTIVRIKLFYPGDGHFIIWPKAWSFYNNFWLKINIMLPLFNFCVKFFAQINTF